MFNKVRLGVSLAILSLVLSGCVNRFSSTQSFIMVTPDKGGACYTRVKDGEPVDQICQDGDFLKYTETPVLKSYFAEIPSHVLALFDALSK